MCNPHRRVTVAVSDFKWRRVQLMVGFDYPQRLRAVDPKWDFTACFDKPRRAILTTLIHSGIIHDFISLCDVFSDCLGTGPLPDFGVLSSLSPTVASTTISLTHSALM
ncbi:hypothetical protein BLNAU_20477 [Blattamonas nauphoetae]|uniref:Uncharacterized protein n=1 Tax=Blattamonas nauphoetae TaxID=2049346 RepID=A0ABQ9WYM0_9EUKA|nr:hypothetical protein BLNAU_20477 [Blattamonas nauphoetae]